MTPALFQILSTMRGSASLRPSRLGPLRGPRRTTGFLGRYWARRGAEPKAPVTYTDRMSEADRIYISDMHELLGRAEHTIRQWLGRSDFPPELCPEREGGRNKIFWTHAQLAGMKIYAAEREAQRGWHGGSTATAS